MLDRMTANLHFHGQALELRAERQQVLASNIANADTPSYLARDFDFAQTLRQVAHVPAASQPSAPGRLALRVSTAASQLSADARVTPPSGGQPDLLWRMPGQPSIDGNTVDLDRERASFADNSLRYEATVRFINGNVRNVLSAIRGE